MMSGPRAKKFTSGWALPMGSWGKAHFYERDGVSAVQSLCGALSPFPAGYLMEAGGWPHCKNCERKLAAPKRAA